MPGLKNRNQIVATGMVQNMENNDLFRKKAVERITSPEKLNDYIHVTSPSIWMALGAIIVLLVGALVWATFGNIYTTVRKEWRSR